jgi:hypothetical protein
MRAQPLQINAKCCPLTNWMNGPIGNPALGAKTMVTMVIFAWNGQSCSLGMLLAQKASAVVFPQFTEINIGMVELEPPGLQKPTCLKIWTKIIWCVAVAGVSLQPLPQLVWAGLE